MKKFGLLTFHDTTNFGSWLQTYGLYSAIEELGYQCNVIDYKCNEIAKREIPQKLNFTLNPKAILKDILFTSTLRKKYNSLCKLSSEKMILSRPLYRDSISQICEEYDKIVVGSDIVWGLDITNGDLSYFLDFVPDKKKKLAFSSSIGTPWTKEESMLVADLIRDFDAIAMREEDAAKQVEFIINNKVETVCDPTMLVDESIWKEMAAPAIKDEKYCLVYFDTDTGAAMEYAKRWAAHNRAKIKLINYGIPKSGIDNVKPITIAEFLGLIKSAAFVCTASYHGLLFSLYFRRQFRFFNRAHKSRMSSIAKILHIDRYDSKCNVTEKIDYDEIVKNISAFRNHSMLTLNKMLAL